MQEINKVRLAKELLHGRLPIMSLRTYLPRGRLASGLCYCFPNVATANDNTHKNGFIAKAHNYRLFYFWTSSEAYQHLHGAWGVLSKDFISSPIRRRKSFWHAHVTLWHWDWGFFPLVRTYRCYANIPACLACRDQVLSSSG